MYLIRVTDETTWDEIAEALGHANQAAKRVPHVLGVAVPSQWDNAHARLDALLDDLERVSA